MASDTGHIFQKFQFIIDFYIIIQVIDLLIQICQEMLGLFGAFDASHERFHIANELHFAMFDMLHQ